MAALRGNMAHAPRSSLAALSSAYTAGARIIGFEVRASREGSPFVVHHADVATLDDAAARDVDLGRDFQVEGGDEYPWRHAESPLARVQSLGALLDAIPEDLEIILSVPADVTDRVALRRQIRTLLTRRGLERRAWLLVDPGEATSMWGQGGRVALRLEGAALNAWLAGPVSFPHLAIVKQSDVVSGAPGQRSRSATRTVINGPLVVALDDVLDDRDLRDVTVLLDGLADAVHFHSTLRLADAVLSWRALESESFDGEDESSRFRFGYAKPNRFAHVFQRDGVHIDLAAYSGRVEFGDESNPQQARLSKLDERLHYALKDWPFYSGGGLGTAFPLDGDFSAEIDYEWKTAAQATMLEMAVVNVDPPTHRPGWIDVDGQRVANVPQSFRDKNAFFDPHGAPPFVGCERDENDGYRLNWNLGADYDNNQYARPHGNRNAMCGRLRLDRRGTWFTAYYRDAGNPDWVCLGSCRNDSMNRRVYLRAVAKRWRQERADGTPGYEAIPSNHVKFRNFTVRLLLPSDETSP